MEDRTLVQVPAKETDNELKWIEEELRKVNAELRKINEEIGESDKANNRGKEQKIGSTLKN